jgi:hypothetical protein
MLSDLALEFALVLRKEIGADKQGVGLDGNRLIVLWAERDPADLVPVLEELEALGFIRIDRGIPSRPTPADRIFGMRNIVGVTVLEPMQDYLDQFEE